MNILYFLSYNNDNLILIRSELNTKQKIMERKQKELK
jgi:hypothetical protein